MRTLGAPFTPKELAAFIAEARRQAKLRTKFRHMGRNPKTGLDCAGLCQHCAKTIGRPVWDIEAYGPSPHKDGLRQALVNNLGAALPKALARAGDIPLMNFEGDPKHVGILFDHPDGGLGIVHTYGVIGRVTEHILDAFWAAKIIEVYRPLVASRSVQ